MQISAVTIFFLGLNIFLGFAIPVGMLLFLRKKFGGSMIPFFAGCITFALAALVVERLFHLLILGSPIGQGLQNNLVLYALYGGIMAGLFEETGRLIAMKLLKKKYDRPETALVYGAGHASIEVIMGLGLSLINYLAYAIMFNSGAINETLAALEGPQQEALLNALGNLLQATPLQLLMSPLERISAIILHISLSVLVWQAAVQPGKIRYYFIAIVLHAAMDAIAVLLAGIDMPIYVVETTALAFALVTAVPAKKVYLRSGTQPEVE